VATTTLGAVKLARRGVVNMPGTTIGAALALGLLLVGCVTPSRPAVIDTLAALPVEAQSVEVTLLDNPSFDQIDWWEIRYTTTRPKETVQAVRSVVIPSGLPIDDANEGFGFTAGDGVEVMEVFTTDKVTTKILVRINASGIGEDGQLE
jgi:hypothetical protein